MLEISSVFALERMMVASAAMSMERYIDEPVNIPVLGRNLTSFMDSLKYLVPYQVSLLPITSKRSSVYL